MRKAQDLAVFRAAAAEIKARRTLLQISQEELAHRAGVHRSFVARLEIAKTQPSLAALFRIADGLEAEVSELVANIAKRHSKELRSGKSSRRD